MESENGKTRRTPDLSRRYKTTVLTSVTLARLVYAINWFNLSPGLTQVASDFHASLTSLGVMESAFLAGAGLFQLPASAAAAKWNGKTLVVAGLLTMAAANAFSAFAPTLEVLTLLRFVLGIGAAMFFSPAISVMTPLFRSERQGVVVGLYNSAFSIGGVIGLFGWSYFVVLFGWRIGLLIGAALLAFFGLENLLVIHHSERDPGIRSDAGRALKGVLKDRETWLLGIGIIGVWSAYYTVTQWLPYFEESTHSVEPSIASLMASQLLLWPVVGSLVGGWLSDRLKNRKVFMLVPSLLFGAVALPIGLTGVPETWIIVIFLGWMDSFVFTAMYASPFQMKQLASDQRALSISLMNSVQILGAYFVPIVFSLIASSSGYDMAWVFVGLFALLFTPALMFAKEPFAMSDKQC